MSWHKQLVLATAVFGLLDCSAVGRVFLNEILFAPPGPDLPWQYLELRGPPNYAFPPGTFVVSVSGDAAGDPGRIENVFDLSGQSVGGNGFLVLLQKDNSYALSANANLLVNSGSGSGFGSGASSSIDHRGRGDRTDLPHASVTFLLLEASNPPGPGTDIDGNDDGNPGQLYQSWTILDSVGVVKSAGDIGYGAINFRLDSAGVASGVVVPVAFSPDYVGRTGNTTNSDPASWVAGASLGGAAPEWLLSTNQTTPAEFSGLALDHIGGPNFGAPELPGIVAVQAPGGTEVLEGGASDCYLLGLNTVPSGPVTLQISASAQTQISVDSGSNYWNSCSLTFTNSSFREVLVRALVDNVIECSPHFSTIRHRLLDSADLDHYPLTTLGPQVQVQILEGESLLLNELKVNPPGTNDAPCEFVEIKGPPGASLTNVYLMVVNGDASANPGVVSLVENVSGYALGSDGLLIVTAEEGPYAIPTNTTLLTDPHLNLPGGALERSAASALLVSSPFPIVEGADLDTGNNGTLEGLPPGASILDAVSWTDGSGEDVLYGGAVLNGNGHPPDAMARLPTNSLPLTAAAWFFGELAGDCGSLVFDGTLVSSNFPGGTALSPGAPNSLAIQLPLLGPLSGVVGDPGNPAVVFNVGATGINPDEIAVSASSSNPDVVSDSHMLVVAGTGGQRTLYLDPVGVGYAFITLSAVSGADFGQIAFPYAASAMGRPGGVWHTYSSDASTAIGLDPDLMLVGDNESNILRLYDRHRSGPPIAGFDFQAELALTPQEHGEINIEASTRAGNRTYFMGAHSNSNSAETRTNRNRLFAVDLSGTGTNTTLSFVGRYDYLKPDLIQWDSTNAHGKGTDYYGFAASAADNVSPKAPDGFNIEGLSMAPGSTNVAWVGFRAPIVPATNRTYALIVPVLNFATLATGGCPPGSAVFGEPIELDLYGRGFRGLEGDTNGYLICGGPVDDTGAYPNDFRLYTWTGNPSDQPQQRAADLTGLLPEGIVELPPLPWRTNTPVQLVSDDGTLMLYNDGIEDKHLPVDAFKKFRSDWVMLGPVVKPVPIITHVELTSDNLAITWRALKGETYRVQFKADLSEPLWNDASADILATGPYANVKLPKTVPQHAFYRIELLSP